MLYIVATPIGDVSEISLRALEVLKNADLVICESTKEASNFKIQELWQFMGLFLRLGVWILIGAWVLGIWSLEARFRASPHER